MTDLPYIVTKAKCIAKQEGSYTTYVFQKDDGEYIMCTKLPNWDASTVELNTSGFLTYFIVKAGEEYFDTQNNTRKRYNYTNVYYKEFIKDNNNQNNTIIL